MHYSLNIGIGGSKMIGASMLLSKLDGGGYDPPGETLQRMLLKEL